MLLAKTKPILIIRSNSGDKKSGFVELKSGNIPIYWNV
jgi:hypothetical protein